MSKITIPVDRSTVRPNPYKGEQHYVTGREEVETVDGRIVSIRQNVQVLHAIGPRKKYLYSHVPTKLECGCPGGVLHSDLEWDSVDDGEGGDVSFQKCPVCGIAVSDFELEQLTDEQCKEALDELGTSTQVGRPATSVQAGGEASSGVITGHASIRRSDGGPEPAHPGDPGVLTVQTRTQVVMFNQDEIRMLKRVLALPKLRLANDLTPLIALLPANAVVVELGSYAGESAQQFLACERLNCLYCVDHWGGSPASHDLTHGADMEAAKTAFYIRIGEDIPRSRVLVIETDTISAATQFPFAVGEELADMVYIDADHRYEAVRADIETWKPKVKPGGWLAGHDYGEPAHPGVRQAVDELLGRPDHVFPDKSWAKRIE